MSMSTRTTRRLGAVALVIGLAACGQRDTLPTAPAPAAPAPPPAAPAPPPAPSVTVSGTALEFTPSGERRPVPNLRLKVRTRALGGAEPPDIVTDADGRYTLTDVSAQTLYFQPAPGAEYRFLCDVYPVFVGPPDRHVQDLPLVHAGWAGDRPPPGMRVGGTSVFGIVSERLDGGLRPLAGASVTLDGGIDDPPATTDESGFYMICSVVGTDQTRTISAWKTGYNMGWRHILGGWDRGADFELTRQ